MDQADANLEDPLFPSDIGQTSESLFREILDDLPAKITPPQFIKDEATAKNMLNRYREAAKNLENMWNINFPQEYWTAFNDKDSVEAINKVSELSKKVMAYVFGDLIRNIIKELIKFFDLKIKEHEPVQNLGMEPEIKIGSLVEVSWKDFSFKLYPDRYDLLRKIYQGDNFKVDLMTMLMRYNTYFGIDKEAVGMHGALPREVFQELENQGVTKECFASPLNTYAGHYCSAFFDVDEPFGSLGNFFDQDLEGSWEANPPFSEELMMKAFQHMIKNLEKDVPLSIAIFVPDWQHPPSDAIEFIKKSPWTKFSISVPPDQHFYLTGHQHGPDGRDLKYRPPHASNFILIQNKKGAQAYPINPKKILENWAKS